MRIAVCLKWVPDPEYPIRSGPDGVRLDDPGLTYLPSPVDLVACEAALRVKEVVGGEVAAFTVGPQAAEAGLRNALALGADEAVRIDAGEEGPGGSGRTARLLAAAIAAWGPADLVVCGARSPDWGSGSVGPALAERLGAGLVCHAVRLETTAEGFEVERRADRGHREVLRARTPLVVTVEPSLCQPRYPALLARRRAERAAITVRTAAELGAREGGRVLRLVGLLPPRPRRARLAVPPPEAPARERLRFILAGGPAQDRSARRVEGPVTAVVDEILQFLADSGIVAGKDRGGSART